MEATTEEPTTTVPCGPMGPPVRAARARLLRQAVLQHARTEHRRQFPALLHVGRPDGSETVRPAAPEEDGDSDLALRVEVLAAMLRRVGALPDPDDVAAPSPGLSGPLVWLTRRGVLELEDVDAAWLSATRAAAAELGVEDLALVVVTRDGWWEPVTGSGRRWRRLRVRG